MKGFRFVMVMTVTMVFFALATRSVPAAHAGSSTAAVSSGSLFATLESLKAPMASESRSSVILPVQLPGTLSIQMNEGTPGQIVRMPLKRVLQLGKYSEFDSQVITADLRDADIVIRAVYSISAVLDNPHLPLSDKRMMVMEDNSIASATVHFLAAHYFGEDL